MNRQRILDALHELMDAIEEDRSALDDLEVAAADLFGKVAARTAPSDE